MGRDKINGEYIDDIIMDHMQKNTRALRSRIYMAVEAKNRDIRREAIGRRITHLINTDQIVFIKMFGGEDQFGVKQ